MKAFKNGKTTITKTGKDTYKINTVTPTTSIVTDIVSLIVACVILYLFGGKSIIWDTLAIVLIFILVCSCVPEPKIMTKEELIKELEEIEQ